MENIENKNRFLVACVCSIILLLTMCYFGINTNFTKGTLAASYTCSDGWTLVEGNTLCCPNKTVVVKEYGGKKYCVNSGSIDSDIITLYVNSNGGTFCKIDSIIVDDSSSSACKNKFGSGWEIIGDGPHLNTNGGYFVSCSSNCATLAKTPSEVSDKVKITFHYYEGMENQVWEREKGFKIDFDDASHIARLGYKMDGWYTAATGGTKMTGEYTVEKDVHFYSRWTPYILKYKFVADAGDGKVTFADALPVGSKTYSMGDTFSEGQQKTGFYLPKLVAEYNNHLFKGWYTQKNCKGELFETGTDVNVLRYEEGIQINENQNVSYKIEDTTAIITIYACYESSGSTTTSQTHIVTFKDYDGRDLGRDTCTTSSGSCKIQSITHPSRSGYTFDGWTFGGNNCNSDFGLWQNEISTTGSITVYACYSQINSSKTFTGTFKNGNSTYATKTCTTSTGSCNMPLPSGAPTKSGYTFTGWGLNDGCTSGTKSSFSVSSNTTRYACYTKDEVKTPEKDQNVNENPKTADIAIFVVWCIGIATIVYALWYFRKIKQN